PRNAPAPTAAPSERTSPTPQRLLSAASRCRLRVDILRASVSRRGFNATMRALLGALLVGPYSTSKMASMTVQFDFTSQDYLRNPAARLERLRASGPIVEVRFPVIIGRTWITTTQEAADAMLKDSATFTLRKDGQVAGVRWWMPGIVRTLANSMLTTDEDDARHQDRDIFPLQKLFE